MGFYDAFKVNEPDEQLELDLTNAHVKDLESQEIKSSLEYVDLTANRLRDIDERLLQLTGLRFICFRQNLLADVSKLQEAACKQVLERLNVADNKLTELPNLSGFQQLQSLEFSYNHEIRSLQPLSDLQGLNLTELYCAENKISVVEAISHLTKLSVLELGSNRIKAIEALESLTGLQQLWLGRNRISAIENLAALTNLRQLSLQANRLESMAGVGVCVSLEELYLSQNGITTMEDLALLTKLTVLDLAMNKVEKVQGLQQQSRLTDLWLNDNPVKDLEHLEQALAACKETLQVVYLENSPAARSTTAYLHIMKQMMPKLEQLDSTPVQR